MLTPRSQAYTPGTRSGLAKGSRLHTLHYKENCRSLRQAFLRSLPQGRAQAVGVNAVLGYPRNLFLERPGTFVLAGLD